MPAGAGEAGGVGAAAHDQVHRQLQRLERREVAPSAGQLRLALQVGGALHHQQVHVGIGPGAARGAGAEQHQGLHGGSAAMVCRAVFKASRCSGPIPGPRSGQAKGQGVVQSARVAGVIGFVRSSAAHQRLDPFQLLLQLCTGDLRVVGGLRT